MVFKYDHDFCEAFLSLKHRERIQAHGDDYSTLLDHVDSVVLPANFGGESELLEQDNNNLYKDLSDDQFSQTLSSD